jgi:hypothetical protein
MTRVTVDNSSGGEGSAGLFTVTTGGLRPFFWMLSFLPSCSLRVKGSLSKKYNVDII